MLDTMDKAASSSDGEVLFKPNLSERRSLPLYFSYRAKILSWTRVEKPQVHEVAEVVAGRGFVVVNFAVLIFRSCPHTPSIGLVEDMCVFLAVQRSLSALVRIRQSKRTFSWGSGCDRLVT